MKISNFDERQAALTAHRYWIKNLISLIQDNDGEPQALAIDLNTFVASEREKAHDLANQLQLLLVDSIRTKK